MAVMQMQAMEDGLMPIFFLPKVCDAVGWLGKTTGIDGN